MNDITQYYEELFQQYGHDERSLGWTKHRQFHRFWQLLRFFDLSEGKTLLDIGCGFGDLCTYLRKNHDFNIGYTGIDIMDEFLSEAIKTHEDTPGAKFMKLDFSSEDCDPEEMGQFDFIVGSGIFGFMIYDNEEDQYGYIEKVMSKALSMSREGVAFDFISDKVDYRTGETDFHASQERILEIAYRHTRNLILDNSVFPFEFAITLFPDQSFRKERALFERHLVTNPEIDIMSDN